MRDMEESGVGGADREVTKREVERAKGEHRVASYAQKAADARQRAAALQLKITKKHQDIAKLEERARKYEEKASELESRATGKL